MKLLQSLFLFGLFITVASAPSLAHADKGWGDPLERRVLHLQKKLFLSDEQANKVFVLLKETKENSSCKTLETFSEKRDCRMSTFKETEGKISSLLSEGQRAQFEEMKEQRRKRHEKRSECRENKL